MKSLLRFIIQYHFFLLFILLEVVAFTLVVTQNKPQKESFASSSNSVSGFIYETYSTVTDYFSLAQVNEDLAEENAAIYNSLKDSYFFNAPFFKEVIDSVYVQKYYYTPAKVINNNINNQYNYLTINKGKKHGVERDMAVVSPNGIAGIIINVSNHYSTAISVLNANFKVSAIHEETGYFGSLIWKERGGNIAILQEIPSHADVQKGDTIVTSGYSAVFPQGTMIGTVESVEEKVSESFFVIEVRLSTDFSNLSQVYLIGNLHRKEQKELENLTNDD